MDYHSVIKIFSELSVFLAITPTISTFLIFALIFLFLISFLFSGAEIAFFSLTIKDINVLKSKTQSSYRRIVSLLEEPKVLFTSLVIGHTLVNIGFILVANFLLNEWVYQLAISGLLRGAIKVAVIVLVLVLFAEILPKVWATHHKVQFAAISSVPVEMCNHLFYKVSRNLAGWGESLEKRFRASQKDKMDKDLDEAIDKLPEKEATLDEKQILKGIRDFGSTTVKQVMRTRLDVSGIEAGSNFQQVLQKVREMIYSRLPAYRGNLDEITGMLHTKDLLPHLDQEEYEWTSLLRPVFYVHEQKMIEDLLQDFRNKRIHIAVVVDEFGGTSGIVTLEDIMEEIIGDIQDEFDNEQEISQKIDSYNYIFEGKIMVHDVCKIIGLPQDTFDELRGDSDSLAGLILEIAGEFPKVNDEIKSNGFIFKPLEVYKNRILKVQLTLPDEKNNA